MASLYADSVNGLDANPGTQALPKRTVAAMYSAAVAGDAMLFKCDCAFDTTSGFFPSIKKNNIFIGSYGTGNPPVFDGMVYENSDATGWTHESSAPGVWSKLFGVINGNTDIRMRRVFVGSNKGGNLRSQRTIGTPMRQASKNTVDTLPSIAANLNANDIWWAAGSALGWKLYIYTGSTTIAPPQFYNGLAFCGTDGDTIGCGPAVLVQGCSGVFVAGIESWGSATDAFRAFSDSSNATPTTNVVFQDCIARYWYVSGFKAAPASANNTLPRTEISNVLFLRCLADSMTAPTEQEPDASVYSYLAGAQDAFAIYDNAKNCRGEYCVANNSMHVGFTLGAYSYNSLVPDQCGFYRCRAFFDSWNTYGRGFTTYNCTDSCYMIENVFDGQNVRCQMAGSPLIYRNVWKNLRLTTRKNGVSQVLCVTAELLDRGFTSIGNERYVRVEPRNVRIIENVMINPQGTPFFMENYNAYGYPVAEPTIADNTVTFERNIVIDTQRGTLPWHQTVNRSSVIGTQRIGFNSVFKGTGNPAATASINGTTYALNATPGCVNNISVDPLLDISNLNLLSLSLTSPCRGGGGFNGASFNKKRWNAYPQSIGPFGNSLTLAT